MARLAKELGALEVSKLTTPGMHAVGTVPGLYLQVLPSGARTWILRAMVGGKRRDMGLGGYPGVSLAGAREAARTAREKIRNGIDPIEEGRTARNALRVSQASSKTFEECARAYIQAHEQGWRNAKHAQQWTNTLTTYAFPFCGSLQVSDVGLPHVLQILEPIWSTKTETATRVRNRVELVLDWATARGYRAGLNPARWRGHLDKLLPKPEKVSKTTHHAALPYEEMGLFMTSLRESPGVGARALELAILTATRSGEVRGATWDEFDLKAKLWTIPGDRMKAEKEHRVPLSKACIELLRKLPKMEGTNHVFTASKGKPLSDMTLTAVLRRMDVDATVHGFRSTFRQWAGEQTNFPREVCEHALAHQLPDKVEAAYQRGDLFTKREKLMAAWADYCSKAQSTADVVPMQGRVKVAGSTAK